MSFVAEHALFFTYTGSAFFLLIIAVCWGNDDKINAAGLLLASILLTNIFFTLTIMDEITEPILNLMYGLMDLFLFWVFLSIARRPAAYERNYWAAALAAIHFCMLSVNLFGSGNPVFTSKPIFMIILNGLMITAFVVCLFGFTPKSWDEAAGVLKVKWLYFKADILDRLLRVSGKKTVASSQCDVFSPAANALHVKIGARVRDARMRRALELDDLSSFLGVGLNDVRAYESGKRRLSATALRALAKVLGTKTRFFFDGLTVEAPALRPTHVAIS